MVGIFYFLVTLQTLLGLYGLWEGWRWLRLARKSLTRHPGFYAPRVALICPVKGAERGLEQNLTALMEFDYPSYEVFFTLASATDPAYAVLRRIAEKSKAPTHIVVAGSPAGCGEKVNNLAVAVEKLPEGFEVLVFTDSDGRPARSWLRHLVAPLADTRLGATTTMRWYFPEHGGFSSALAAAWNAPIATYLGEHQKNFCWGGGTAIRRQTFEEARVREYWRGSVSDDYSLTRALRNAGYPIQFVPECLVPTQYDVSFDGLLAFTNRQMVITRVYAPGLWALTALGSLLYCVTVLLGLGLMLGAWLSWAPGAHFFLLALVPSLLAAARGYLRVLAVSDLLPTWNAKLLAYGWVWTLLAALVPFLYLWNSLVAAVTRRIAWRGVRYELISPEQTRVLSR